jgi:hypothetical protein
VPEPDKKKAGECPQGTLIVIDNTPLKLFRGRDLPLIDRDGSRTHLLAVIDERTDITVYIHPEAVVDVIWEPKPKATDG